jgi:hypothetical protein
VDIRMLCMSIQGCSVSARGDIVLNQMSSFPAALSGSAGDCSLPMERVFEVRRVE